MLTIRFNRIGKKNKAYFRLVVQEHTIAPGGGHVEILGSYDPHLKKDSLKPERIKYWVEKGVKFSDTAFNFLVSKGFIDGPKRTVKLPKKPARIATPARNDVATSGEQSVAGGEEASKEEVKSVAEEKKPDVKEAVKAEEAAKPEAEVDPVKSS